MSRKDRHTVARLCWEETIQMGIIGSMREAIKKAETRICGQSDGQREKHNQT